MNKETVCKKTKKITSYSDKRLLSRLVVLAGICLFILHGFSYADIEDGAVYAKEQNEKIKQITAPYADEVNQLVKSVLSKQAGKEHIAIQKEFKALAKSGCPMQNLFVAEREKPQLSQAASSISSSADSSSSLSSSILIFVSFSMPKESIKGWIREGKKIKAPVYIRGLVNNSFKDTAKAVSGLVQDQVGGLLIDPNVFKKYGINRVPAVVVVKEGGKKWNDQSEQSKNSEKSENMSGKNYKQDDKEADFDVVYGDVSLDYALEKINKHQGGKNEELIKAITKTRVPEKR